jgi:CMP-N,N'-diacetyllegionaminic acid synthase
MRTIATICARGGSKGLPGKNIKLFLGKPLIAHAIAVAKRCSQIEGVYVSTDAQDIADVAVAHGARVLGLRPPELATDASPKLPALLHLTKQVEAQIGGVDRILDLQPTSPLTGLDDVRACLAASDGDPSAGLVTSAFDSGSNPYYTMVETDVDGFAHLSKPSIAVRRQDAPKVLTLNGAVYVWRRAALEKAASGGLWSVPVKTIEMPKVRSVDIDDALDWDIALFIAERTQRLKEAI